MAVTITCASCGKQVQREPSKVKAAKIHYCSRSCHTRGRVGAGNSTWKGEAAARHAGHVRAIKAFDLEPCAVCGATPDQARIHRHHIDENPLNNDPSNIRFLCARHHSAEHAAKRTHCPHGHPYDEANTMWRGNHRVCRACANEHRKRYPNYRRPEEVARWAEQRAHSAHFADVAQRQEAGTW